MRILAAVILTLSLAVPADLQACGESLYRVGKGVVYREYTAPLPGNLLVYGAAAESDALAAALGRAGHQVSIARSPLELAQLASSGEIQVVIGPLPRL